MRKIFLSILFVVLVLYPTSYPKTTEAAGITPTMEVTLDSAYQGFNGLWNWKFNIKTTYTPDNTKVAIETYELIKKVSNTEVTIKDNSATYVATNLKSGQAYSIYFTLGSYNPAIKKTYSGTPGSSSQKPQINNFSPTEGKVGDIVTITGNYLGDVKNIFFGAKNADTSKATIGNAEIKVPVPDGAMTGKITVKNTAGETVSSQIFTLASDPVNVDTDKTNSSDDTYTLLAPLPGLKTAPNNIGDYFNIIFRIAIALCAVLAVIMIIIGGIGYMGSESIFGKTEAKSRITAAILGLIIALGAYALLNTIDPNLLGKQGVTIKQVSAEIIDLPDAGDGTVDPDFSKGNGGSYSTDASVSSGVTNVVNKLKQGWEINQFRVYTNNRMLISIKKGSEVDNSNIIDIRPGINGYAPAGTAKTGDRKTPVGSWKILSIKTSKNGQPVYNKTGANMGATFWLLSPMASGERGIGMHGNKNGTLSGTYGCIRLKNADLLALLPYVKPGIVVNVGN